MRALHSGEGATLRWFVTECPILDAKGNTFGKHNTWPWATQASMVSESSSGDGNHSTQMSYAILRKKIWRLSTTSNIVFESC